MERLRSSLLLGLGAFAALAVGAAPAQAQIAANGGFETADFTNWALSGESLDPSVNNTFVFGGSHSGDYAAYFAPVGSDGFLSQTLATTPGQAYVVSYWLSVGSDSTGLVFTPNDFSASFGGQTLTSATNLAATDGHADSADDYTQYSFTTVAAGTSSLLQFGLRDDNAYLRLDDISVTPAAVPEASTTISFGLLLALGLGAAAWKTRRRVKSE